MKGPRKHQAGTLSLAAIAGCLVMCSTSANETLQSAVESYNAHLRWKRFSHAANYQPSDRRALFLQRYVASEDDLHIQSIEVQGVQILEDQPVPTADITAVAERYLLPSTVVEKVVMTQRWELRNGAWIIISTSNELAPSVDREAKELEYE